MQKLNLKIISFLIFAVFYLFLTSNTYAAGIKLGIYPPILQIEAIPPARVETTLTIINFEEQEINLKIVFKPFIASNLENGEVEYLTEEDFFKDDPLLFQKIKVLDQGKEITEITLAPKQRKDLKVITNIPKNQTLSDYYFSIIFVSTDSFNTQANQSLSVAGIASNVLLSVGPKDATKGNLEEYSVPYLLDSGPVPFTIRVKNKGSHFFTPKGEVLIKNLFGQTIGRVNLLPVNVLAQSIRSIPDALQSPEATKSANTAYSELNEKPVAYWNEKFLLGPYAATLTIALSDNGPMFRKTIFFLAFPAKIALGVIVAVLIVIFIWRRVKLLEKSSRLKK